MKNRLLVWLLIIVLTLGCAAGCRKKAPEEESAAPDAYTSSTSDTTYDSGDTPYVGEQSDPDVLTESDLPPEKDDTPSRNNTPSDSTNTPDSSEPLNLWVSPVSGTAAKARPISAVQWAYNKAESRYYLYLPTEGKLSNVQVWFAGAKNCSFGDRPVQNGETVSFFKEGSCTVTLDKTEYPLTVMKSANVGSMYITTKSGNMDYIHAEKGNEETGTMRFVNAKGKELYNGNLKEIKGRGNATWDKPKKPYQIKLETKTELIDGAGTSGTWLLLANYCEKTMVNNTVALNMAYDAGLTNTVRSSYIDLYCNGAYMGSYQLSEKVQIAENRIEINDLEKATEKVNTAKLSSYPSFGTKAAEAGTSKGSNIPNNPADITGGYLLELEKNDRYPNEASGFVTKRGTAVVIKEPEYATAEQVAYISNFFQEFEDAVYAKDGINPTTRKRFDEYFDLTSLAKKYILEEFVKNIDADTTSQYFYKPADSQSKVGFCGPVWDYDNAFDVMYSGDNFDGLYAAGKKKKIFFNLCKHDVFMEEVKKQWKGAYLPLIAVCLGEKTAQKGASLQPLDDYYQLLSPSAAMNYTLWDNIDEPINNSHVDTGDTYQDHFDYLRNYIKDRRAELNQIWLNE